MEVRGRKLPGVCGVDAGAGWSRCFGEAMRDERWRVLGGGVFSTGGLVKALGGVNGGGSGVGEEELRGWRRWRGICG